MNFGAKVVLFVFVSVATSLIEVGIDMVIKHEDNNPVWKRVVHSASLVVSGGILGVIMFAS